MAYIGMRKPMAAPISSHTDGAAITYGTGFVIGPAVSATINFEVNDNPDYGNDVIIDNDNGINGYSGTMETNDIADSVRAALLGWTVNSSDSSYSVTDTAAPYVGFGFIRVKLYQGVRSYDAFWFHKAQFTPASINAATKQAQITWNHPQMNINGMGVYLDSTGNSRYFDYKNFETEAAAVSWLQTRANITVTT